MPSITLRKVCLDYALKSSNDSIKRGCVNLLRYFLGRSKSVLSNSHGKSFRALNDISLDIRTGDRVGILGKNGAGKSTLLKVLAKIYQPQEGTLDIQGKVSSLFDVNLGMNPEASGYENIVNLAVMRGIPKKQAYQIFNDVESFTELGGFLDNPVRTYSSGMQMKLAFAVATSIASEIMLIDEIIGVGDIHFMRKAEKRIESAIRSSHILVLTSHSNETIRRFCNKALVLEKGQVKFYGAVDDGINFYKNGILRPEAVPA